MKRRKFHSPRTIGRHLTVEPLESRQLLTTAPLMITEFMAANDETLVDGDGESSDWIEIFNPSSDTVSLENWFLTDDPDRPTKWPFPNQQLPSGGYQVIFASGQSADSYVDPSGNLHANFRLNRGGEYLALNHQDSSGVITAATEYSPAFPPQYEDVSYGSGIAILTETLIAEDAAARYIVPTNDSVDAVWMQPDFDDATWQDGPMGIGYEDSPADYAGLLQSRVPLGTDSAYLRIPFQAQNVADLDSLTLRARYDDGFVAYLNGVLLPGVRDNAPASLDYQSVATGNHPDADAVRFVEYDISSQLGLLNEGPNVLAVHSLNQASSSDMLVMAELVANRPSTSTNPTLGYFPTPTPARANSTGIANPGPVIRNVTQNIGPLDNSDALVVTAEVTSTSGAVANVQLHYRADYRAETMVLMLDDGNGPDTTAGDGIYTAVIPATAAGRGDMLRWYVTANDAQGAVSREPAFLDSTGNGQSPEYFGTVVNTTLNTDLPTFQWFTENVTASHTRSGTRASVYYAGRFYDNVFVRQRGGATNASQSQKFDFNRDDNLWVSDELGFAGEINLNGNGSDPSYLRQPMGFNAHTQAGGAASASFFTAMYVNGGFDRVGIWIEQVDGNFLERQGYDRDGDLYKLVQRSNLQPAVGDTSTGVEKKTGSESDLSSFASLVRGVELRTEAQRQAFIRDHLDIPQVINYMAVRSLQHQADDVRKNIYLYQDTQGDELWRIYPWDLDWTFNIVGGHDNLDSQRTEHPFWGVQDFPTADGANQWNKLYEALFETEEIQTMFLRRLRTLMDEFYGGRTGGTTWFADDVNQNFPSIDPHLGNSATNGKNSLLSSIQDRRRELYSVYTQSIPGYDVVIPDAQPSDAQIEFGQIDFNPVSGNQDEEYIELKNPQDFAVDISGWHLAGGVSHTFQPGTVLAAGSSLYVTANVAAFRDRAAGPTGGQRLFTQQWTSGHLSNFTEPLELRTPAGTVVSEGFYDGEPSPTQRFLRITEMDYHPDPGIPGATLENKEYEYVELMNVSSTETLDLAGVHFSEGIEFTFPSNEPWLLGPQQVVIIAANTPALLERFQDLPLDESLVVGEFQAETSLANNGERIKLEDAGGNTILEFAYNDKTPWPTAADGEGASLSIIDWRADQDPDDAYADPANWFALGNSPGFLVPFEPSLPGDANQDGNVDFADFLILSANFGKSPASLSDGDFDNNGSVDFSDFLILSGNFGRTR